MHAYFIWKLSVIKVYGRVGASVLFQELLKITNVLACTKYYETEKLS
jgi:hypothetical protein